MDWKIRSSFMGQQLQKRRAKSERKTRFVVVLYFMYPNFTKLGLLFQLFFLTWDDLIILFIDCPKHNFSDADAVSLYGIWT